MPFTKFSSLDFDQIKTTIKDYLRANTNFTDFDFEGSNFSILIDTLAYNTYITSFNANMIANESFLDSAVVRDNVVSLARTIGYVPRSKVAAQAKISFSVSVDSNSPTVTLQKGIVSVSFISGTRYIFSIPTDVTVSVIDGVANFDNITIYQGNFITQRFIVDTSLNQRYILDNDGIDTSTLSVYVKDPNTTGLGKKYSMIDNIINVKNDSEIFLIQEVPDERYEILFGDGLFGKKLTNLSVITASYIQTDGKLGNDVANFVYQGTLKNASGAIIRPVSRIVIRTNEASRNGDDIESISSIKYFAPRLYSSQYRAVTARDYEAIISNQIYTNTESISVIGGEELDPPQFGTVLISIKPRNGIYVSEFDKEQILSKLKQYSMAGINAKIIDLKLLYVEIDSSIYYDDNQVSNIESLRTKIINTLEKYASSLDVNKFGGRFKYSKTVSLIDNVDRAITSNITKVTIRRNLFAPLNQFSQYELCFGNRFHVKKEGYNIKSTGFTLRIQEAGGTIRDTEVCYFTDIPNDDLQTGVISVIRPSNVPGEPPIVVIPSAGTVDYIKGEIIINTIYFVSTEKENNVIEVQAYPESNDVLALKDLYLVFDITKSKINMVKDVIASGDDISGVVFSTDSFRSSYSNGNIQRS
jgi:hypothetical protein